MSSSCSAPELAENGTGNGDYSADSGSDSNDEHKDESSGVSIWPGILAAALNFLSFFMTIPYISEVVMKSPYAVGDRDPTVKAHYAEIMLRTQHSLAVCHSLNAFAELVSSGFWGVLVDRVGVKPIGVIGFVGHFVNVLVLTLCSSAREGGIAPIKQVFTAMAAANVVAGLCGNFKIAGNAYVARVSTPTTRNKNFIMIGATISLCVCLGPMLGILVHKKTEETRSVLWVATALSLGSVLVAIFLWPGRKELPVPDCPAPWRDALPCFLFRATVCLSRPLLMYGMMNFVDHFGLNMLHGGYAVFVRKQYHWSSEKLGVFFMLSGIWGPVVQRFIVPALLRCKDEFFVLKVGYLCATVGLLVTWLVGLQPNGTWMYATTVLGGLGYMANPIQSSLASGALPKSEMGRLFAAFAFLETLSKVVAPVGSDFVMSRTLSGPMPSAVFLAAAFVVAPAVVLAFFVERLVKKAPMGDMGPGSDSSSEDSSTE